MNQNLISLLLLVISLLAVFGVAVVAFLSSYETTQRISTTTKRIITGMATLMIFAILVTLTELSDIRIVNLFQGPDANQTSIPNS